MFACHSPAAFCASRLNRSRYSASVDTLRAITFSASRRGNRGCSARYTSPMAPAPSNRVIAYPANVSPVASGMRGILLRRARTPRERRGGQLVGAVRSYTVCFPTEIGAKLAATHAVMSACARRSPKPPTRGPCTGAT